MSVTVAPAQSPHALSPQTQGCEVEESCPVPFLALFASGALWLFIAAFLGLVVSLKFHNPSFLADIPFLTYGRVHAAQVDSLLYGFGLQMAMGVGLWLLCQLGRAPLFRPRAVMMGMVFWNLGLTLGILGTAMLLLRRAQSTPKILTIALFAMVIGLPYSNHYDLAIAAPVFVLALFDEDAPAAARLPLSNIAFLLWQVPILAMIALAWRSVPIANAAAVIGLVLLLTQNYRRSETDHDAAPA